MRIARKKSLEEILGKTDKDLYLEEIASCIMQTDRKIIENRQERTLQQYDSAVSMIINIFLFLGRELKNNFFLITKLINNVVNFRKKYV
jgi:hypothetical protein